MPELEASKAKEIAAVRDTKTERQEATWADAAHRAARRAARRRAEAAKTRRAAHV